MIESVIALLCGLVIGSFLNVCIHRWPRGRSVVKPRSHCVRCRKFIAWYDNVPLVSYVVLGGRCRHCGKAISLRYPAVELVTGLLFFYFVYTLGLSLEALKMCVFAAIAVALLFTDLEKRLLPDELTLGGTLIGLAFAFFVPMRDATATAILWLFVRTDFSETVKSLVEAAAGAAVPAIFLWGGGWVYEKLRHREGLGFGDVKLIAMVGAFMGLRGALATLLIGSVAGSILGYGYIRAARKDAATFELPFGSFLSAAALFTALAARRVLGL